MDCTRRFTTYEKLAESEIVLLKRSGKLEPFDRDKLLAVVTRLARGRRHAAATLRDLVRGLEAELVDVGAKTVASSQVAERLHQRLGALDPVLARRFGADYTDERGQLRFDDDVPSPQLDLLAAIAPGAPGAPVAPMTGQAPRAAVDAPTTVRRTKVAASGGDGGQSATAPAGHESAVAAPPVRKLRHTEPGKRRARRR
jgi:transcriptional regulator NrdR family protein